LYALLLINFSLDCRAGGGSRGRPPPSKTGITATSTVSASRASSRLRLWGCGELYVVNLFALRATDPKMIGKTLDPVGTNNRVWVEHATGCADMVVCAWGADGTYMDQGKTVLGWIKDTCEPMCLGVTKDGYPKHPLYVRYGAELVPFMGDHQD
jgi:hypothetical protein